MTFAGGQTWVLVDSGSVAGASASLAPSERGRGFFVEPLVPVVFKRGLGYVYFCSESGGVNQAS
jgi:hypothetical protein